MEIKKDPLIKQKFFDDIRINWGNRIREGIHLSDLLSPRLAYFQRVDPKPPTDRDIMYFLTGEGHEAALLRASGYKHGEAKQWEGLWYTPDIYDKALIEVKTRRRNLAKDGEEAQVYDNYLQQLKGYVAVENIQVEWKISQGQLWIWCLLHKEEGSETTEPAFDPLTVTFTEEELETERQRLRETKGLLEEALASQDFSKLPYCPKWKCCKSKKIMVTKPFCETCNREFETDWGISKHLDSAKGKGHEVKMATYDFVYYDKCKWFSACQTSNFC